jgi:hypothetical protein
MRISLAQLVVSKSESGRLSSTTTSPKLLHRHRDLHGLASAPSREAACGRAWSSARVAVDLPCARLRPACRRAALARRRLCLLGHVRAARLDDGGVDDLPAQRQIAALAQRPIEAVEQPAPGTRPTRRPWFRSQRRPASIGALCLVRKPFELDDPLYRIERIPRK